MPDIKFSSGSKGDQIAVGLPEGLRQAVAVRRAVDDLELTPLTERSPGRLQRFQRALRTMVKMMSDKLMSLGTSRNHR